MTYARELSRLLWELIVLMLTGPQWTRKRFDNREMPSLIEFAAALASLVLCFVVMGRYAR
jgi:hypothetical protein